MADRLLHVFLGILQLAHIARHVAEALVPSPKFGSSSTAFRNSAGPRRICRRLRFERRRVKTDDVERRCREALDRKQLRRIGRLVTESLRTCGDQRVAASSTCPLCSRPGPWSRITVPVTVSMALSESS